MQLSGNGELLSELLSDRGIKLDYACGKNGTCGKCKIIARGELFPPTPEELKLLTAEELEAGYRLACKARAKGKVLIKYATNNGDIQGLIKGNLGKFKKNPISGGNDCYCLAVDIGTTTIASYLYKMPECELIDSSVCENPQRIHGADIISRIEFSNSGGLKQLEQEVNDRILEIKSDFGVEIEYTVYTGNTTMLHLLTGLDPRSLAVAPFKPSSLFGYFEGENFYVPCISAYVGGDITTAILSSGMYRQNNSLLIDVGTNGEMALNTKDGLFCCSTAAGPAFEGAGIKNGMVARAGAINRVDIDNEEIKYSVIGDAAAAGFCGTGLLDAVAVLLKKGIIDETGYMEDEFLIGGTALFPEDVRAVQLAKSAVRSGIDTLLNVSGLKYEDVEKLYIAGGFGSYMRPESCAEIGLIPKELENKVIPLGNAAGAGASLILCDRDNIALCSELAKKAKTVELSNSPFFMEKYVDNMMF